MNLLSVTTFCLMVVGVCGSFSELESLIRRIHDECDTAAVYFIGDHERHLKEILKKDFDIPRVIYSYFSINLNPVKSIEENVIVVVDMKEILGEGPANLEEFILRLRVRKFIVVFADSFEILGECFQYFHGQKFTRIFGIVQDIPYAYMPYADRTIQHLDKDGPLPDAQRDFNGFRFRTTVQSEIPRVFWYKDTHGDWKIGGYIGQLFLNFLRRQNASFTEVLINNSSQINILGMLSALKKDELDIGMNTYSPMEGFGMSYPISLQQWTIMVPINGFVESREYFIRPFTGVVWIFIGLTYIYIVVMDILKDFYADVPIDLWFYLRRTFLKFLFMASEKRITSGRRFHCQVLLFAFVLTNFYLVYLTSFLTVFIQVKQYNTIRDLIDHKVTIMMVDYEVEAISDPEHRFDGIGDILELADLSAVSKEWYSMRNTSKAYAMGMDRANFLIHLQMKFTSPRFHTTRDSLLDYYLGFMLDNHSPFKEILDDFIIDVADTGLMEKWTNDAVVQGHQAGLEVERQPPSQGQVPLTLNHLSFAWKCLGVGLTIAFIVFVLEMCGGVLRRLFLQKWH